MSELNSVRISGSGCCGGGEYSEVRISGSGKITGDVKCDSMHISGSGKIEGEVDCKNDIRISGSGRIDKDIKCDTLHISGAAKATSVKAKKVHISGSCSTEGKIEADEIKISGVLSAGGDICGETVQVSGGIKTSHLLSGETVDIKFSANNCIIGEIGGGTITVRPGDYVNRSFGGLFQFMRKCSDDYAPSGKKSGYTAQIGSIEGDDITAQDCIVDTIRGTKVTIMSGCEVKRVEYSGELTVEGGAKVEEQIKI